MTLWLFALAAEVSVIAGAALAVAAGLRQHSAAVRHWLLLLGLIAVICAGPMSLAAGRWLPTGWRLDPAGSLLNAGTVATPAAPPRSPTLGGGTGTVAVTWAAEPIALSHGQWSTGRVLVGTWLVGMAVMLAVFAAGTTRLAWLMSRSTTVTSPRWRQAADDISHRYGLRVPIRLVTTAQPALLATWGVRRHAVLLPAGADRWELDRIRAVLAHELAHVVRRDWTALVLATVARAVFWFHPLVWLAARRLQVEGERACDDRVLALGTSGPDYASHLVDLARLLKTGGRVWLPVAPMARTSQLHERIQAMLAPSTDRRPVSTPARLLSVVAFLSITALLAVVGAQSSFHTLDGVVRDATNRVLPDARVVLTNAAARSKYEVRSDRSGHYEFVGLPAATYTIEAFALGFKTMTAEVRVSSAATLDLALEVGSLEERISVRAGSAPPAAAGPDARQLAQAKFDSLRTRALATCADPRRDTAVGGNIMPPVKLLDMRPAYPAYLRDSGIGGVVTMTATIGTDGIVRRVDDVKGPHPELERAAEDAVRQWQFSQTWLNCEPVEVEMRVTTSFVAQ